MHKINDLEQFLNEISPTLNRQEALKIIMDREKTRDIVIIPRDRNDAKYPSYVYDQTPGRVFVSFDMNGHIDSYWVNPK